MLNFKKILFLVFLTIISVATWMHWPQFFTHAIKIQRELNNLLSELIYDIHEGKTHSIFAFIGVSFLYGLIHSLGAGHGKIVVASYLVTNKCTLSTAIFITVTSALLQALVAISIIEIMIEVYAASMAEMYDTVETAIRLSYLCIIGLGILLMAQAFNTVPKKKASYSSVASIVLSIGIRPCTGAVMVLLFANMVGYRELGIYSALAMAFGTAMTTSIIACLSVVTRKNVSIVTLLKAGGSPSISKFLGGAFLAMIGYIFFTQSNVLGLIEI
ncbi:hypothetical protein L4C33_18215 [Vibrio makurazakiensis]|uniref:nickel/cobalt transporter n=1 Tax=Vibrio makurazakiensis TaxID=2910250 RepID=UPI003D141907